MKSSLNGKKSNKKRNEKKNTDEISPWKAPPTPTLGLQTEIENYSDL